MERIVNRVAPILDAIEAAGGYGLIVGGAVRDHLLGLEPKDIDVEAYNISIGRLAEALSTVGVVNAVGEAFGVLKVGLSHETVDVSVPRKENRIGAGHRDFEIQMADLTPKEAAQRRDFTINAMAYDRRTGEILDFYNGRYHLDARILQPTSEAFREDALRVLRGMQFVSRFGLKPSGQFANAAYSMLSAARILPKERVWEEWRKWALGRFPSRGLQLLVPTGWLALYPEIERLFHCDHDPYWHPEGDVAVHTCYVVNVAATIATRDGLSPDERTVLVFAALCHDFGKPATTITEGGRIRSPGHAQAGVEPTESFLRHIGCPPAIIHEVVPLVREHLAHLDLPLKRRSVLRLAHRLQPASIEQWARLVEADQSGRPPLPASAPAQPYVELAQELEVSTDAPKPLLMGRHLIDLGMQPGPAFKPLLNAAYEMQLDGELSTTEDAIAWIRPKVEACLVH